jgi:uncharacterized hydrophobic protein (TIGR00271 family)
MEKLIVKILGYFKLQGELEDFNKIHETVEKDIIFKGTNLWILVFAIIVASVGLNMNSTAVIIGAMLISPLMGPINGIGYSLATYNFPLFRKALKNLAFAVGTSLAASTAYFFISPVSTAHSELLARTSPTIYDVLIALFGGLAGIIAISSRQKGNVIPGVAIATALMPPLCTAGYGLATGQFIYLFGALYLFTINAVFIAISALIICQILKFPIRTIVDKTHKVTVTRWTSFIILLTLIPSIYFGYGLVQKEKFMENGKRFVEEVSVFEGNYLLRHELHPNRRSIKLVYVGNALTDDLKDKIKETTRKYHLEDVELIIDHGFSLSDLDITHTQADNLKNEVNRLNLLLTEKVKNLDSLTSRNYIGRQLLTEISAIYPQITSCSYSESLTFNDATSDTIKVSIIVMGTSSAIKKQDKEKINQWLKSRLKMEAIKTFFE